jgi:hypothetical protein
MANTVPIFDPARIREDHPAFCGAFIDQPSYIELLRAADAAFQLNMTSRTRVLPCQQNSYLVMSRSPPWRGIGRPVSLTVDSILYNSEHGVLLAMVKMKNNFTCNKVPHIVIAKRPGMTNIVASHAIDDSTSKIQLCSPLRVHGKIGVITGSHEEFVKPVRINVDGMHVVATNKVVTRPEVVYTVEQPLDDPRPAPTPLKVTPKPKASASASASASKSDVMEITLEKPGSDRGKGSATAGTYMGEPIIKGPRGGCYIIKDGKKKYVPAGNSGEKAELVYNINILE